MRFQLGGHFPRMLSLAAVLTLEHFSRSRVCRDTGATPCASFPFKKERSMNAHERPVITDANKTAVRGGSTGNNLRYVLIGSVALALLAWILVEYFVRP
jgi:hypothetical protein